MGTDGSMQVMRVESPRGNLRLAASEQGLCRVELVATPEEVTDPVDRAPTVGRCAVLQAAATQIHEYLCGDRQVFDLPLDLRGTSFQKRVWQELVRIPFGVLVSYGAVAAAIGKPRAVRAVGGAIGRNPLLFVVPCHRVVGKNGDLTGFSAGMSHKRWLLAHEQALLSTPSLGITEA